MMNKTYVMMSIVILVASITGITIATSNFMDKLHEKERADAELAQAKIEYDQAVKDYSGGDILP
jgi:hypothetical protein